MSPIAIIDPFSGIAGDMMLGALLEVGLESEWLRALPARLGLDGVEVRIQRVLRAGIACTKVDFEIPPQPHGRHIKKIREMVAAAGVPALVRERADAAFTAIAEAEGEIHGLATEKVHLHEVGAVDALLDVVGSVWGLTLLGVDRVYCGPIVVGDGTVKAAHGILPVPAPATLKLLEGHVIRPGPEGAGELVTPTGAALVRALSSGPAPASYTPLLFVSMKNCTVLVLSPAGPEPENATVPALVRLSLLLAPVSLAAVRWGALGAGGTILLTVKASSVRSAGVGLGARG